MPKIAFCVLFILGSVTAWCQEFSYNNDGKIHYEYIDTVKLSKDTLYDKVIAWVYNYYPNAKAIVQIEDKSSGKIICKPVLDIREYEGFATGKHPTLFTLDITIRDNRIRLQAYNLLFDMKYHMEIEKKVRQDHKDKKSAELFKKVINQVNVQIGYLHNDMLKTINKDDGF